MQADGKFCQDFSECMHSLNTIVRYQKTEQKNLVEKNLNIFNFLVSRQIF